MINQFGAEALGKALACTRIGDDTYQKGQSAFVTALGEEEVADITEKNHLYTDSLMRIATDAGVIDATLAAADALTTTLEKIRDIAIDGTWNDVTALMAWSGMFEGAAIAYWGLLRGTAEATDNEAVLELCEEALSWHYDMLEQAEGHMDSTGQSEVSV